MEPNPVNVDLAVWIVRISFAYAGMGVLFAVPFAFKGAGLIDPVAEQAPLGFRVLLMPGAAALWPILLIRWTRGTPPPDERTPHTVAARTESSA